LREVLTHYSLRHVNVWNSGKCHRARFRSWSSTGKVINELTFNFACVRLTSLNENALPNMYVQPETRLYTVADLSRIWVNAQVFQNNIGSSAPAILPKSQ